MRFACAFFLQHLTLYSGGESFIFWFCLFLGEHNDEFFFASFIFLIFFSALHCCCLLVNVVLLHFFGSISKPWIIAYKIICFRVFDSIIKYTRSNDTNGWCNYCFICITVFSGVFVVVVCCFYFLATFTRYWEKLNIKVQHS